MREFTEVGRMLLRENARSLSSLYEEEDPLSYEGYVYREITERGAFTAVEGLNLLAHYEYQADHHPEWKNSEAYSFCESLRNRLIARLPGMSEMRGEWTRSK